MTKARSRKPAIPKRVAGVKVPKRVRKGKGIAGILTSDLGREIMADVLMAAAGAAAAALTRSRAARTAGPAVADSGTEAGHATNHLVETATGALAGVVTDAARNFLPTSLTAEPSERSRPMTKASRLESRKRSKPEKEGRSVAKRRKKRD